MRYSLVTLRIIRFHFLLVSFLDAVHRSSFQFVTLELHNMYSHAKNSSRPTFFSIKICAFHAFSVTLPLNGGVPSVHCGAPASWLIGKIEALCSFLQGENVGNFQSLQKSFEEGSCATLAYTLNRKKLSISASRLCVELNIVFHLFPIRVLPTTLALKMWTYSSTLLCVLYNNVFLCSGLAEKEFCTDIITDVIYEKSIDD